MESQRPGRLAHLLLTASCMPVGGGLAAHPSGRGASHGHLGPAGKLAGLVSIPICQLVPDERAGELGPGTLGCQPAWSSKASEALALLPLPHILTSSEMWLTKALSGGKGKHEGHECAPEP